LVFLEQAAERTRKEATGSGEHAGSVQDAEEQRKVGIHLLVSFDKSPTTQ